EKAQLAREAGAGEVVLYTHQDFVTAARHFGGGHGVDVVYDSVGKATFEGSLNSLKRRGMLVMFGQSSGSVPPFDIGVLARRGSLFLTRASLNDYIATRDELLGRARDLFSWISAGELKVRIDRKLPLEEAAEAHRLLEGRQTSGKVLLEVAPSGEPRGRGGGPVWHRPFDPSRPCRDGTRSMPGPAGAETGRPRRVPSAFDPFALSFPNLLRLSAADRSPLPRRVTRS